MTRRPLFDDDNQRWQALVERDRRADGAFLYAVKTTGIYCRPSCASRTPNRENVLYFRSGEQAEKQGYRACKKCRPDTIPQVPEAVLAACRLIDQAEEPPGLEELAEAVQLSPSYLHRLFKKTVGVTPRAFAAARRTERFRNQLQIASTVTEAMYESGYAASSRCYEEAGQTLGMTPTEYRGGGAGQTISTAIVQCSLGWLAVAATSRGICSIQLGDHRDVLQSDLETRFPHAQLQDDDESLEQWVGQIVQLVEAPGDSLNLPLDIQGTAFQRKVWEQLRAIPVGTTLTYTEVARRIGKPSAVRAVASACAANQLAVVIPCHRVVRRDGNLSGYRWGIDRKRQLLEREQQEDNESCHQATGKRKR